MRNGGSYPKKSVLRSKPRRGNGGIGKISIVIKERDVEGKLVVRDLVAEFMSKVKLR